MPKSLTPKQPVEAGLALLEKVVTPKPGMESKKVLSKTMCSNALFVEGHKCSSKCASSKAQYNVQPFSYAPDVRTKLKCSAGTGAIGTKGVSLPVFTDNDVREEAKKRFKESPLSTHKEIVADMKRSCWVFEDIRATFAESVYIGMEAAKTQMAFDLAFEGGVVAHEAKAIAEDAKVEASQATSKAELAQDTADAAQDTADTALAKSNATSTELEEIKKEQEALKEMVLSLSGNTTTTSTVAGPGGKVFPVTPSSSSIKKRSRLALEDAINTPSVKGTPSSSPIASPASTGRARKRLAFNFSEPEEDSGEIAVAAYKAVSFLNKNITHVFADVDPSTVGRQDYGIFLPKDRILVKAMDEELEGLPCACQVVYRACKIDANEHSEVYSSGVVSVPHFVTASTADFSTLNPKPEHNCFITIRSKTGRLVENLVGTNLQAGKEVVFKRFTAFKVISMDLHHFRGRGDVCVIVWEEM